MTEIDLAKNRKSFLKALVEDQEVYISSKLFAEVFNQRPNKFCEQYGLTMRVVKHGSRYYLVFTL